MIGAHCTHARGAFASNKKLIHAFLREELMRSGLTYTVMRNATTLTCSQCS